MSDERALPSAMMTAIARRVAYILGFEERHGGSDISNSIPVTTFRGCVADMCNLSQGDLCLRDYPSLTRRTSWFPSSRRLQCQRPSHGATGAEDNFGIGLVRI